MKPTVDIVGELLDGFTPSIKINEVTDNLNGTYTVVLCETLNLRNNSIFEIDNQEYIAIEVVPELKEMTFAASLSPQVGDLVYPKKPFYFHGTPIAVGGELSTILNGADKLPMVYLYEIIRDEFEGDKNSSIDRTSNVRLFFLDEANFAEWDTDHHYSLAIVPMANYAKDFVEYLSYHKSIGLLSPYSLGYHAKFGISINQNGHIKNLFSEELSGVEINITLPIKKSLTCNNCA